MEYARDLGSRGRETVRVRVPPSAPFDKEEIRNSNIEIRNKSKIKISKLLFISEIDILKIRACFEFRTSDFEFSNYRRDK